jgi:ABC-type thiamin/hydroxymethylpyrimidine transport system permease subunit
VQEHAEVPAGLVLKVGEALTASFAKAEGHVAQEECSVDVLVPAQVQGAGGESGCMAFRYSKECEHEKG